MNPVISIKGVQKYFGTFQVLKDIDFDIAKGEVVCVIGPSGSGKSTMLRCINQFETFNTGTIRSNGEIAGYRRDGSKLSSPERR